MHQYIGFNLNSNEYMIPILNVREIVNMPVITSLPQSPQYIKGITNLRGSILPVVDLKMLLRLGGNGNAGEQVIVIASGKIMFGIVVEGITGVINIDSDTIEQPQGVINGHLEQVEGIAKLKDRLIVLLDPKKLLPLEDMSLFEDAVVDFKEVGNGDKVEVTKKIQTIAGEVIVKETHNAREFFNKKFSSSDPKHNAFNIILDFMEATAAQDYEKAEAIISQLFKSTEGELYKEVGKVTRRFHDSIKEFKEAIDPGLKKIAKEEVPNAVDKLQFVITKTEDAANRVMGIVEKYLSEGDKLLSHIENIKGPQESISYLRSLKESLNNDMTEILMAQEFQDITGQTIKKVIGLVNQIEKELLRLITTFGVKIEDKTFSAQSETADKLTQTDVEKLLGDFGF